MTTKEFIIEKLNIIVTQFPCVQCSYQFDKFTKLHSVEVLPTAYLNNEDGFGELQFNITQEFISTFPDERLSFFSTGNSIELESEQLVCVLKGKHCLNHSKDVQLFPDNNINIPNTDLVGVKEVNYAVAA